MPLLFWNLSFFLAEASARFGILGYWHRRTFEARSVRKPGTNAYRRNWVAVAVAQAGTVTTSSKLELAAVRGRKSKRQKLAQKQIAQHSRKMEVVPARV
ncbi:hypothetical protein R1flu_023596 [Riccia fluitans]|uniref:Secreted protein n=1 Tax=Riccia fluitans TaxID=41844 RepID=A0ABD1XSI8_9MARC